MRRPDSIAEFSSSDSGTCRMPTRSRTPPSRHHGDFRCHPAFRYSGWINRAPSSRFCMHGRLNTGVRRGTRKGPLATIGLRAGSGAEGFSPNDSAESSCRRWLGGWGPPPLWPSPSLRPSVPPSGDDRARGGGLELKDFHQTIPRNRRAKGWVLRHRRRRTPPSSSEGPVARRDPSALPRQTPVTFDAVVGRWL